MVLDFSRSCKIWRKIALGCAQELGERRDTSRSPLGLDRAPLSFPALGVSHLPLTCFSLFPSTDTITTPTLTPYHDRVLPDHLLSPFLASILAFVPVLLFPPEHPGSHGSQRSENVIPWPPPLPPIPPSRS